MALPDAVQGDQHTGLQITVTYAGSTTPKPITGATISGAIYDPSAGTSTSIAGVLAVVDGPGGVFSWSFGAADTATPGEYTAQFTFTYGDGKPDSTYEQAWNVRPKR